jgi:putative hemolysin
MKTRHLALAIGLILASNMACAMLNPSSVYCSALGYKYFVRSTPEGDIGFCSIPLGNTNYTVDSWKFLQGEAAQQYSYCALQNYTIKTVVDPAVCSSISSDKCAVCVVNSKETEVTALMNLSFAETICGDSHCGFPENYANCPQDCQSGGMDQYCDGIADGICDPDCVAENQTQKDPDCQTAATGAGEEQPQKTTGCLGLLTLTLTGLTAVGIKIVKIV